MGTQLCGAMTSSALQVELAPLAFLHIAEEIYKRLIVIGKPVRDPISKRVQVLLRTFGRPTGFDILSDFRPIRLMLLIVLFSDDLSDDPVLLFESVSCSLQFGRSQFMRQEAGLTNIREALVVRREQELLPAFGTGYDHRYLKRTSEGTTTATVAGSLHDSR